ncbi:N-acetylmuramoyl-L-alanine amidase [Lachnospiraceae bacterium MD1]|uniref:N-acetylmuramoyl-L-alanine amidase n=1 Tax=Variimorphobacter saccharofermentans TaxID=2755051 RepID=A0A839JZ43_9FIRM|nr:N-acetylmuramoyl-L-alanine amidase [Variimorphobacter saccharofermentans]MBB2182953.1 N-acetylmuramoyl-L-alanine amidase [Variimorphobacter saccharofermentans]
MMTVVSRTFTNDKRIRTRFLLIRICCLFIIAILVAGIYANTAEAASGLKIYYYSNKKQSTYTDKKIKVTLNGKTISKTNAPGILVNGVALLPYDDIFKNSGIEASCSYNKEKGTITISKFNNTITMTIGSKSATLNGKKVTLSEAPIKIKYVDANLVKILVPSRFVAENLGLSYTWNSSKSTVAIEKNTLNLSYNNGQKFEYYSTQGKVTIDGKSVNLGTMPSIITNNTAMLRAKKVFADSSIKADYKYDSKTKTVTLTKGTNKLVMTIGSKTAYLNDKKFTLDAAPLIVKNHDTGYTFVMVPGSNTAKSLGYNYSWNSNTKTSVITSKKKENPVIVGSGNSGTAPELGDSSVTYETGTILKQWSGDVSVIGKSTGAKEINNGSANALNTIYSVARDYGNSMINSEIFQIVGTSPFSKITSSQSGNKLTIQALNTNCADQTYQMYGSTSYYINTISTRNTNSSSTTIDFEAITDKFTYDLSLSTDQKTLYVTIYFNTVTSAVVGTNSTGDYLNITGISTVDTSIIKQGNAIYVTLPNTSNSIGDIYTELNGAKYLQQFYTLTMSDKTQFILVLKEDCEYYIQENGNHTTILLQSATTPVQPTIPVTDSGSQSLTGFDIVIPKPEGIQASMIHDEDYYYNKEFVIKLPGDYTEFLRNQPISSNSSIIKDIRVSLNSSNETEIRVSTSRLQGYEYTTDDKNIYVNVGDPGEIYKNIVVLDPGHGGKANGAEYFGTKEKDVNFKILYTIGKQYFNQDPSKLKVYYTRTTDVDISLNDRAAFAEKCDADLFVSLHMNASTSKTAAGTEVYYSKSNNSPNDAGLTSSKLAEIFVSNLTDVLGTSNRGAKHNIYTVVHKNTVPAVLIELGFLSNSDDYDIITDEEYQDMAAQAIYETLLEVFEMYPTGR